MNTIEMRQKRANIWEQMKALHERAQTEGRALTAEEREQWTRMDTEINDLRERIEREERAAELEAEMATTAAGTHQESDDGEAPPITATPEYRKAYRSWLRGGMGELEPEQRKLLAQGRQELPKEARALAVGAGPAGGLTVADESMRPIVDAMAAYGGIRAARVTTITTATGGDLPVPMSNDTGNMGRRIGENQPVPENDPTVAQKVLRAYMYTSDLVRVPYQFIQDTSITDFEAWLGRIFGRRIGRITNLEMTNGVGGGAMPEGLLWASVFGAQTAGAGVIAYGDMVELEHSVDPVYRNGAQWMFHDQTLKELKQLTDLNNRPLWVPGMAVREPDTILGYRYVINQDFPAPGAGGWNGGERAVAFGDMSAYTVRDVRGFTIIRLDERYADNLQVGFLAFGRHDGALIDAGMHPIRHLTIQ